MATDAPRLRAFESLASEPSSDSNGSAAHGVHSSDPASLAAFRIAFGALLLVATLRYFTHGWIAEYFLVPEHFFKYWGFGWVVPWPGVGMYLHFALMAVCAVGVLLGYRYRASITLFGLLFVYQHLIDKTNYLNHYYLVACLCALSACLPLHACWSLDARRDPRLYRALVPGWTVWALRAQFGLVYVFGGLAKLNHDWLVDAQPLTIWLGRHQDLPILGSVLSLPGAAHLMSFAGASFDLSIVPLLSFRRTRLLAYPLLVAFHLTTACLFSIGLFPWFMICGSLMFLPPSWPRRVLARIRSGIVRTEPVTPPLCAPLGAAPSRASSPAFALPGSRLASAGLVAYFALQLLIPLRHWAYPGDLLWSEQGFRFSWNVMLMEKDGVVDFRVVERGGGRTFQVSPRRYFTAYQTAMMSTQPDMVLEAAQVIARDYRARGVPEPAVYADAFASLNGGPMQRLIDPSVDLARQTDTLAAKPWILPRSAGSPLKLARSIEDSNDN